MKLTTLRAQVAAKDAIIGELVGALTGLKDRVAVMCWTVRNGEQAEADAESLREEVSIGMGDAFEVAAAALTRAKENQP